MKKSATTTTWARETRSVPPKDRPLFLALMRDWRLASRRVPVASKQLEQNNRLEILVGQWPKLSKQQQEAIVVTADAMAERNPNPVDAITALASALRKAPARRSNARGGA
jgi:hypothetical protein